MFIEPLSVSQDPSRKNALYEELAKWFSERPKWLQDAAYRIIEDGQLTDEDLSQLVLLCKEEANGKAVLGPVITSALLEVRETPKHLRLESISDVQGINALCPRRPLEFGETQLCIVFGSNGTGKSGYVRLLKHVSGARQCGQLLGNVYVADNKSQAADLKVTDDGQRISLNWSGSAPLQQLAGLEIYDTASSLVYVDEENEVAFEPWLLRLFTQLTDVCTGLNSRLHVELDSHVSKKPAMPAEYAGTAIASWYNGLCAQTRLQDVAEKTAWLPAGEANLSMIMKRLAEANPRGQAAALRRAKNAAEFIITQFRDNHCSLSKERCEDYTALRTDAQAKRKAADEDARKVFELAPLGGVGSASWRLLWEQARRYSEQNAYPVQKFPNITEEARCVLCQRKLDKESRDRFTSFERFVKDGLQQLAGEAEKQLAESIASFPELPNAEALSGRMDAASIMDQEIRNRLSDLATNLSDRRTALLAGQPLKSILDLQILDRLSEIAANLEGQAIACDEDAKGENRPQLQAHAKELGAKRWISQQRSAIEVEIMQLQAVDRLRAAQTLTATQALSRRKSILADELITNAYVQRFQSELVRLKADHLSVHLKKVRTGYGRVYHRICLKNATRDVRTSEILSEGEFRIVSLAAFLADVEGRGTKTPFIFDDPISSLDQKFEDATAKRLVELSLIRQVIVFTHRLSLVGSLERYADKNAIDKTMVCLSRMRIGEVSDLPIMLNRTKPAANRLLDERLAKAKRAFAVGESEYENEAKALCRDIRILMEHVVETDLLGGIVRRYSPEVQTKNKIARLAKIETKDCEFVDLIMTKYSRYEHSQPDEASVDLPTPDEIQADLKAILQFIETVRLK